MAKVWGPRGSLLGAVSQLRVLRPLVSSTPLPAGMQLAMPRCHFLQSTVGSVPKGRILCERWPVGSKGGVRPGGRWRGWSSVNQPKTTGLRSHRCSPGLGGSVPAAGLGGCISVTGPQLAKPLPCEDQDPLGRNLPPPTVTPSAPSPVTSRGSGSAAGPVQAEEAACFGIWKTKQRETQLSS